MSLGRKNANARAGAPPRVDRAIGWPLFLLFACSSCASTAEAPAASGAGGALPNTGGAGLGTSSGGNTSANDAGRGGTAGSNDSGTGAAGASSEGGGAGEAADDGGAGGAAGAMGSGGAGGSIATDTDGGRCMAVEAAEPLEGAGHTNAPCEPVSYASNPPSSGTHYGIWTEFKTYDAPVPEGFWVHSLEHGAVVISYNCPGGCTAEVAAAQAMIDSLPVDPLCYPSGGTSLRRVVMTPDPHLTTRFAASAWGFTLRAACFDPLQFRAFALAHYAHTVEDFCSAGGYQPADYPPTCGQ